MTTYTAEQITAIGGREWTGYNGQKRVYLNNWYDLVGLEISTYKTGNVSSAALNGEPISNSAGNDLRQAKVWLDVATGQIRTDIGERAKNRHFDGNALVASLLRGIAARVKAATSREVTTREAAEQLGVSTRTVRRWAAAGKLTARKDARGHWTITL